MNRLAHFLFIWPLAVFAFSGRSADSTDASQTVVSKAVEKPVAAPQLDAVRLREIETCFDGLGAQAFRERRRSTRRLVEIATTKPQAKPADKKASEKVVHSKRIMGQLAQIDEDAKKRKVDAAKGISHMFEVEFGGMIMLLDEEAIHEVGKSYPYLPVIFSWSMRLTEDDDPEVAARAKTIVEKCKRFVWDLQSKRKKPASKEVW